MNSTAQYLAAVDRYSTLDSKTFAHHKIRETSAYVPNQEEFWKIIKAGLLSECREEIENITPAAGAYLPVLRRIFLTLLDEGSIQLLQPISQLAQNEINQLRRLTGIGSVPAPTPTLTPDQQFEQEVITAWTTWPSGNFRARCNNDRKWRETFKKLSETDRIAVRAQASKSDEQLAAEVQADYRSLPGKEFQAKRRNSAAYNAMFEKLANENRISL